MAKFSRKGKNKLQAISTASLPDIVFMLLFFFMVTTVMKDQSSLVKIKLPRATEVKKLENRSLVSHIRIGTPQQTSLYGSDPRIQLNDAFATVEGISEWVSAEREKLSEVDKTKMTVSLKVDQDTEMGIVSDVKQALRKASALKINYSTTKILAYEN
ncbi:MAG: biopolymer transporter ExbD [Bacteroidetes bacterium]|jgi:biopolymer transport protein ExbD|nr:biopolymer transporter ExbD [Bacteroidota bacterium]